MKRGFISRVAVIAATAAVGLWLAAGPAGAVTPAQCEKEGGGEVDVVLDPGTNYTAVCTCKGGFYTGQEVFGPHIYHIGDTPMPITCAGLEIPA
ncbi:hypothetical protein ACFYTQ_05365 [Nocardia sp. NPDC004068]|uniref:hypothetical protein n=1 Tax=Nocardia sp. NPDC004068 TaxID=3364303 RepID=UPI00369003B9